MDLYLLVSIQHLKGGRVKIEHMNTLSGNNVKKNKGTLAHTASYHIICSILKADISI